MTTLAKILENEFLGKIVYHNYGQIGFGVVIGIDETNPKKPKLRVQFARSQTPKHLTRYANRPERSRTLLPRSVTISKNLHGVYNSTNKIAK